MMDDVHPARHRADGPILEIRGSSKRFGGLLAVDHVSFEVAAGQVCGLIGPNGAGKSTLFNLTTGVTAPTDGEFHFCRKPMSNVPLHRRVALGMARTFQIVRVIPGLSVLENVMIGFHHKLVDGFVPSLLRCAGVLRRERRLRAEARVLLEFVGLGARADEAIEHLPHGQQRLVEIARALASEPRLLLLDEPAAGLNQQETQHLARLLQTLNRSGMTVMLVEHDIDFIMGLCDHIVVLDHGTKIAEGTPQAIQRNDRVIEAYLGRTAAHAED